MSVRSYLVDEWLLWTWYRNQMRDSQMRVAGWKAQKGSLTRSSSGKEVILNYIVSFLVLDC